MPFLTFVWGAVIGFLVASSQVTIPQVLAAEALCEANGGLRYLTVSVYGKDKVDCVNGANFNIGEKK